jgi:hypothetical protein
MGLSRARRLSQGTVACIYLRPLEPAESTELSFVHTRGPALPATTVRCLGIDVLGDVRQRGDGTSDLELSVEPAPMDEVFLTDPDAEEVKEPADAGS